MSTKAELLASNESIRDDANLITPDEDCNNRDLYMEEHFPDLIDILSTETTYATPVSNASYPYRFFVSKNGGKATINGYVMNKTVDQSNTIICEITDPELLASAHQLNGETIGYRCKAFNRIMNTTITLLIIDVAGDTVLKVDGAFPANFTSTDRYEIIECLPYNTKN